MSGPHILSIREQPDHAVRAIRYIQSKWPEVSPILYEDCITHAIGASAPLPQWYLLRLEDAIIGCSGLVTNDFISRMDLYPWICALYIEERHRGHAYGALLLEKSKTECARLGFPDVYLSTDHVGYYEKYGFLHIAQGYGPGGDESRIYGSPTAAIAKK